MSSNKETLRKSENQGDWVVDNSSNPSMSHVIPSTIPVNGPTELVGQTIENSKKKSSWMTNAFQTPNICVDRLMILLTSDEWKVLTFAFRRIYGFNKRTDHISISQFRYGLKDQDTGEFRYCGTGLNPGTIKACQDSLVQFRVLKKLADNNRRSNKGSLWGVWNEDELSANVDWDGLMARYNITKKKKSKRTEPARGMRRASK